MSIFQPHSKTFAFVQKILVPALLSTTFATDLVSANDECCYDSAPKLPSATECCGMNGFIEGDFLFWRPYIGGLQFAFQTLDYITTTTGDITTNTIDEFNTDPQFKWDCGYRIGGGYNFSPNFDLAGFWVTFEGRADQSINNNVGKWHVNFDQFDVVGRYRMCFQSGYAQPFIGIRGARITQHLVSSMQFNIFTPITSYMNTVELNEHQDFQGIGPVIGLNVDYDVGCGFGLFGSISGSVMYGTFKRHWDDSTFSPVQPNTVTLDTVHADTVNAGADLVLGFQWENEICNCMNLNIRLLGEHHHYFNQNYIGGYGDLSFDGVSLSVLVSF